MTSGHCTFTVIAIAMVSQPACEVAPADEGPAPPGAGSTALTQIMASESEPSVEVHGFLRDKRGAYTTIDKPDSVETSIRGINNRGKIVGAYVDAEGIIRGFLLEDGAFTSFDAPDATVGTLPRPRAPPRPSHSTSTIAAGPSARTSPSAGSLDAMVPRPSWLSAMLGTLRL
jgi:hypothetical protein